MAQASASFDQRYDHYNREERYACTHLFRLLHEPTRDYWALREFLGGETDVAGFRIFAEVALIRDAYYQRRQQPNDFMDALVELVAHQEGVSPCRLYSQLEPKDLCNPQKTHPREIRYKAGEGLSLSEKKAYGAVQGMFNAKPDLVVCVGSDLIVFEAKLTLGFDAEQLTRTRNIADVWSKLLYRDLDFEASPRVLVRTLGSIGNPDVSWKRVHAIAEATYPETDRTRRALARAASA